MFAFIFDVTGACGSNQSLMDAWGGVTQGTADHHEHVKKETPSLNLCVPGP